MVPAILLGVAGVILVGIVVLVALTFANGPGLGLVKTDTPVPTVTPATLPHPRRFHPPISRPIPHRNRYGPVRRRP